MSEPEPESGRAKRQRTSYKSKAFEKFKQLKSGQRNKYEVEELENVYETVEEGEYVKRVLDRQDEDWIVDDDGSGYVEDGRDIFDDDLDEQSIKEARSKGKGVKRKKVLSDQAHKGNLKYMLSNISSKKKEKMEIEEDDNTLLSEILGEADQSSPSTSSGNKMERKPFIPRKQIVQNYFKKLEVNVVKKSEKVVLEELQDNGVKEAKKESVTKANSIVTDAKSSQQYGQPSKAIKTETNISQTTHPKEALKPLTKVESEMDDDFEDMLDFEHLDEIEGQMSAAKTDKTPIARTESPTDEVLAESFFPDFSDFHDNIDNDKMDVQEDVPVFENDDKEVFRFFWWDAFEDREKKPGVVFLFGKTYCSQSKTYVSCCVAVKNISRQLFLLPRPYFLNKDGTSTENPVTHQDLYSEFASLVSGPIPLKTYRARFVKKKYAFDPLVPSESDYMEVRYPASEPKINFDCLTHIPKTFSRIFGLNTTNTERLLLDCNLKGPGWLDVKSPEFNANPLSWCKIEVNCNSVTNLVKVEEVIPPPPLVVATVNFRIHINRRTNQNEILMATCVVQSRYSVNKSQPNPPFDQHFCVIAPPAKQPLPLDIHESLKNFKATRVQKMDTEKALLNYFLNQFSKIDPDLVVGHNLSGYQDHILAKRLCALNVSSFSKLSRLRRTDTKNLVYKLFTGRLLADIKISAKELIKSRSYDLSVLCQNILKIPENQLMDLDSDEVSRMFETSQDLLKLVGYTMQDTAYMLKIMYDLNVVPLALEITRIAGNVMSKTLMGGRSERNEYLLLHAFSEKGYIVPDKQWQKKKPEGDSETSSKKKPSYSGGLVLDPKVGFYNKLILLMDFNSLYPSIIQEYNICFTTLPYGSSRENRLPDPNLPPGILPTEIRKLVDSRRQVKSLMNAPDISSDLKMQYHIRQMALKLTANSMYGCLGFYNSRFFRRELAALITEKGREILMQTKTLTENSGFEVVYGDTDSIMINTNATDYQEALKIGQKIKQDINKSYKSVELDIDGIFKYLLLLKKKKYAAVVLSKTRSGELVTEVEYKGLDIVRRDWCPLASQAGKLVLEQLFADEKEGEDRIANILSYLRKLQEDLKANKIPVPLLVVTMELARELHQYLGKEKMPHANVALRYNEEHGVRFRQGDTVPYVVCNDGTTRSHTLRAYHPDELKTKEHLSIDTEYYLAQQIFPVVGRICEPIEGIDLVLIAECLGLDPSPLKKSATQKSTDVVGHNRADPMVKYRNCEKFVFTCLKCGRENAITGPMNGEVLALSRCSNPECTARPIDYLACVQNQLILKIRSFIEKYYEGKLYCEDPMCTFETYNIPLHFAGRFPVCAGCRNGVLFREYTERDLYYQLEYFAFIFDLARMEDKSPVEENIATAYALMRETAEKYVKSSAYAVVDWMVFKKMFDLQILDSTEEPAEDAVELDLPSDEDDFE